MTDAVAKMAALYEREHGDVVFLCAPDAAVPPELLACQIPVRRLKHLAPGTAYLVPGSMGRQRR